MPEPSVADFAVKITRPDKSHATVFACRAHLAHTRKVMQSGGPAFPVTVGPANRGEDGNPVEIPRHGCKGCQESWPVGRLTGNDL